MASSTVLLVVGEAFRKTVGGTRDTHMFCHLWENIPEDGWGAGFGFSSNITPSYFATCVGQSSSDVAPERQQWT